MARKEEIAVEKHPMNAIVDTRNGCSDGELLLPRKALIMEWKTLFVGRPKYNASANWIYVRVFVTK